MIPLFPEFKKLELTDKEELETITRGFPPYSDYNFVSMYSYNTTDKIKISLNDNNLIVIFEDYLTEEPVLSFLGENNFAETVSMLLAYAKENGIVQELQLIPESNLPNQSDIKGFIIKEDPDNHDYILSVDELAAYSGKKFYDKRNLVNRFTKKYPSHETRQLDLTKEYAHKEILKVFAAWEKSRNKDRDETKHELIALQRLMSAAHMFQLHALGVYLDNEIVAFSIKELLPNEYAIIHFEKNNIAYEGISSYLRQQSAKYLQELGCKYINFEQDMGIPGLKKAKSLWRPIKYLKKYTIKPVCE